MTDRSQQESKKETFEEFKNSFSYGSRSDLNFKFLKFLPDDRAALFFEDLLDRVSDSVDDGTVDRLIKVFFEFQREAYIGATKWTYSDGPFTALEKPISKSRVALVTSSGHFVAGKDPQPFGVLDMTQEEAAARINEFLSEEPVLSPIPIDTPLEQLRVRHGGYDIRAVQADPNVALPITRLQELTESGRIGELLPTAYSFHGACAQSLLTRRAAPQWSRMLQLDGAEAVVLVPVCPVCHVSVGHLAREFERAGMATVVIGVAPHRDRTEEMSLPRLVVTPHLMGRPLGAPHDVERQTEVLLAAIELLDNAEENGSVVDFPGSYRPTPAQRNRVTGRTA